MQDRYERALKALNTRNRLRVLTPQLGIDFSSNDYLGLSTSTELSDAILEALERGVPIGAGGSRLLRGNKPEHECLEAEAAGFFGAESCLFMGGGFAANTAIFSCLPQRGDLILYDELIHASSREGIKMGNAEGISVLHNNLDAFETNILKWRKKGHKGQVWIALETIYSMEGDTAPLESFNNLAQRYDAMLVLDEAHATGIFGPKGQGLGHTLEGLPHVISLHTCGKALGVMGALILAPRHFRDFLINRAKPFIYATAPSPLIAAAVRVALKIVSEKKELRTALFERIKHFRKEFKNRCNLIGTETQIQPIILKSNTRALLISKNLQKLGFDVRAIRPPTVPEGSARLRVSLTLNATSEDITSLIREFEKQQRGVF
ncbi:MAG: 8-amino-7-oxononanoate synthase [Hyphomicrobium sp.]